MFVILGGNISILGSSSNLLILGLVKKISSFFFNLFCFYFFQARSDVPNIKNQIFGLKLFNIILYIYFSFKIFLFIFIYLFFIIFIFISFKKEIGALGGPILVLGLLYIIPLSKIILPDRKSSMDTNLNNNLRQYTLIATISEKSNLIGNLKLKN